MDKHLGTIRQKTNAHGQRSALKKAYIQLMPIDSSTTITCNMDFLGQVISLPMPICLVCGTTLANEAMFPSKPKSNFKS